MNLSSGADASWGCGDDFKLKIVDSTGVEGWSEIFSFTGCEAQLSVPTPPSLTVATSGTSLNLDWNDVSGADSYTLYYAPYPSASPIYSLGMETNTSLAVELPIGTSFYVATTATNVAGESNYSNIEHFTMTENPVQGETINSIYLSGVDPFLLFKASDLPGLSPSSLLATF
ncbi:MAG: hypothetical protein U9R69_07230, partial [Thermodesulfobacteriota bacterium]|nr:hypothetical protein [Thermodesulfobacteriota bacterium]